MRGGRALCWHEVTWHFGGHTQGCSGDHVLLRLQARALVDKALQPLSHLQACVCVCVFVCILTCVYMCVYVYMFVCVYTCVHVCVHVDVCIWCW